MCLTPGTLIHGEYFKKIEDVKVGDFVYGHDGELHRVADTHKRQYGGQLTTITAAKTTPLSVTEEHPVLVYRTVTKAKFSVQLEDDPRRIEKSFVCSHGLRYVPIWVKAKDVLPGDYVAATRSTRVPESGKTVPLVMATAARKDVTAPVLDAGLAFLFGFFVGDGDVKGRHGIRLTCSLKDDVERLCSEIKKFGVEPRVVRKETYTRIIADSVVLAESFRKWFGDGAYKKNFPDWLINSEFSSELIEGYLAADGCEYNRRKQCVTTSWKLAQQVQFMLRNCGIAANVYRHDNSKSSFPNCAPTWMLIWQEKFDRNAVKCVGSLFLHKVKSVENKFYEGEVFNIEVEDVRSYVADGLIVHNCLGGLRWRAGNPEFRIFQSWGPRSCSGPDPGINDAAISGCSWWSVAEDIAWILRTGDCWVLGDQRGLPKRTVHSCDPAAAWGTHSNSKSTYELQV
jgi:helicase